MKKKIRLTESELTRLIKRLVNEVSQKDFDEMGEQEGEMIRISFPLEHCVVRMEGFMVKGDMGYSFMPMENGFSYGDCGGPKSMLRHIPKLERVFNNLIGKKLAIDSGRKYGGGAIRFGRKNDDVWIPHLLMGDESVLFEKI